MSILYNGSYVNNSQQLWANLPSVPTTTSYVYNGTNTINSGFNAIVNNLKIGAQYLFTINLGVYVPNGFSITIGELNDGTNSLALEVSSQTTTSSTLLPLELVPSSTGINATTANFPGTIVINNTWASIFNGAVNTGSMPFTNQIILTPQSTSLYFSIQNVNTSPSVPNSAKVISGGYITTTLLSI